MDDKITLKFEGLEPKQALDLVAAYSLIKNGVSLPVGRNDSPTELASNARTAEPSTGSTTATVPEDTGDTKQPAGTLDSRGVPLHPTYHNGNVKGDGSWTRRRNHDKAAADAYEAPYLAPKQPEAAPAPVEPQAPAASAEFSSAPSIAPAVTAEFAAPAVRYLPSPEEYEAKWKQLCRDSKVTGEHQAFIERTFGSHPLNPAIFNVEENRRQIWVVFLQWEAGVKGF